SRSGGSTMRSDKAGLATRWIIGGLSATAIVVGVSLLLGDITKRQPERRPELSQPGPASDEASLRQFAPPPPRMAGQNAHPPLSGIPAEMRPGMPPGIPTQYAPQYYPKFDSIWKMTPTTVALTKLPEGKPFMAGIRTIVEMQLARYGNGVHLPLPPADQA